MNTKKGIAIGLAAVMISMIAACAVPMVGAETEEYTATVTAHGMEITVTANDVAFGTIEKGADSTITNSLTITNAGDKKATVEAKFITDVDGVYGLTNTTVDSVIPASNFEIATHLVALNNDGSPKPLGANNDIPRYGSADYDAKLTVPNVESIPADDYSGTVELIFTSA
jgi:hypothetical protein